MGCAGQCSGSGGCGCGCAGPAARARHSSSEPVEECGSGDTPLKRVLLSARGRTAVPIEPLRHAALLPGLGEVPLRRLRDGRTVVNGPEMDRRATARHFKDPKAERGRRARLAGVLVPPAGGGSSGREVWFGYRDTEFTVPSRWLVRYQSALARQYALGTGEEVGIAAGVDQALAFIWADVQIVLRATGVDLEGFDELLSCYNLPTDSMPSDIDARFWHLDWGPPQQFYRWTNALIVAFSAQIREPCTHDWHCDGFGSFVASVLRGETAETDLEGNGPCRLRFRMMNDDTANAYVAGTTATAESWTCGEFAGTSTDCDEGFLLNYYSGVVRIDRGSDWDLGFPPTRFDTNANAWIANGRSGHPSTTFSLPLKSGSATAYVYDGTWSVTLRPEYLAWFGYLCDYILYLARMAFDYARDTTGGAAPAERADYRRKAYDLGRYALRIMTDQGRLVIHELGHVHNGWGGHCSRGECCFDLAGYRWQCSLSALLGLPIDTGTSDAADTWTNTGRTDDRTYCQPKGSELTGMPEVHCGIVDPGDTSTSWLFWCTDCSGALGFEDHR